MNKRFRCSHKGLNEFLELHGMFSRRVGWRDIEVSEYDNIERVRELVTEYAERKAAMRMKLVARLFDATPRRVRMWWPVKYLFRDLFRWALRGRDECQ